MLLIIIIIIIRRRLIRRCNMSIKSLQGRRVVIDFKPVVLNDNSLTPLYVIAGKTWHIFVLWTRRCLVAVSSCTVVGLCWTSHCPLHVHRQRRRNVSYWSVLLVYCLVVFWKKNITFSFQIYMCYWLLSQLSFLKLWWFSTVLLLF